MSPEQEARRVVDMEAGEGARSRNVHARPAPPSTAGGLSIADLSWMLFQGRRTILAVTGAVLTLALVYLFVATPIYQANVLLQIEERTKSAPGIDELSNMLSNATPVETEMEAMRSRSLLGAVVDELGLDIEVRPPFSQRLAIKMARGIRRSGPTPAPLGPGRFAWAGERVEVRRLTLPPDMVEQPLVLRALGEGRYRLSAGDAGVQVLGEVGKLASSVDGDRRVEVLIAELVARPGTEVLVRKLSRGQVIEALQDNLQIAEKGRKTGLVVMSLAGPDPVGVARTVDAIVATYQRQHITQRSAEAAKTLDFLESQLPILKRNVETAEATLNAFRQEKGTVDLSREATVMLDRSAAVERALSDLDLQRSELRQRFTEDHPSVVSLAQKAEKLRAERSAMQGRLRTMPETERDSARLVRDVKVASELYSHLLNKAQELRIVKSGTIGNVRIVDDAMVPERPVSPKRSAVVLLALVLGLGAGVAAVIVRHAMDEGMDDPHAIEAATGIAVFVTVPRSEKQVELGQAALDSRSGRLPVLATVDSGDAAIETLRSLRTSLQLALEESGKNVVAIGSPGPGVGKSFVCVNLAHVLAAAERRVLLVDGDLRRGQLHRYFGLTRQPGLSDVASGKASLTAALRRTSVEGLDLLTTGHVPRNPSELLASARLEPIMAELSRRYDLVLIDTPPALAVADPALLARHAAVNLLVLRAGQHPVREIALTLERLRRSGVQVTGAVLNDARALRGRYGRYGHYYRYEYRSDERA
jgi:tyrosine-protein kinase Etk/Wzc